MADQVPEGAREVRKAKLPLFHGNGKDEIKARDLIARIENIQIAAGKRETAGNCGELYLTLRGNAVEWYNSLGSIGVNVADWAALKAQFLRNYDYKLTENATCDIGSLKQKPGETITDYWSRVNSAVKDFNESIAASATVAQVKQAYQRGLFLSGVRDDIKTEALQETFTDLASVLNFSLKMEFILNKKGRGSAPPVLSLDDMDHEIDAMTNDEDDKDEEEKMTEEEIMLINRWRNRTGRKPMRGGARAPFAGTCHNCGKKGHKMATCRLPQKQGVRSMDEANDGSMTMASIKNW